jgi:hypothetical protein
LVQDNKPRNDELKPLNPHRYLAKKVFRQYSQAEPIKKPEKEPAYKGFPEKIKNLLRNYKPIIIFVLVILIFGAILLIFFQKSTPKLDFIDKASDDKVLGQVYMDNMFLGDTDGENFRLVPEEYCKGTHTIKLVSGDNSFEWQTYPIDCKSKKVIFYIDHKTKQQPNQIAFKFLDGNGDHYVTGSLYFDGILFGNITEDVLLTREECANISKIRFDYGLNLSVEKANDKLRCDNSDEVEFRIS